MTDESGAIEARCQRCNQPFRYLPVRVAGMIVGRRTTCPGCVEREECEVVEAEERLRVKAADAGRAEREAQRLELLQQVTGNAAAHRHMTFDSFDPAECGPRPIQRAREFANEVLTAPDRFTPVRGLYLHGTTGPGKTHLVVAVIQQLLADPSFDPRSIVFDRADELILRIQATYGTRESVFDTVLDRRIQARLWVLDDLGTERPSEDAARYLTMILSNRELMPTLVTSNFDPGQLSRRFTEFGRAESRFGPRYFRTLEVKGRDRRFDRPSAA